MVAVAQDRKPVILKNWGEVIDPDGDCRIKLENGKLTVTVPVGWHALDAESNKLNAPAVLRDIEGDFIAEVEVDGTLKPVGPSTNPRSFPFHGAGLLLWSDAGNYLRLERASILRDNQVISYALFEQRKDRQPQPLGGGIMIAEAPIHLRLERKGNQINVSISTDGKNWRAFPSRMARCPARVKLGVAASSSSGQPFTTVLEHFRVLRAD
jgi:regulation of enolase protein 1 (concanavalin A-like superfamily)